MATATEGDDASEGCPTTSAAPFCPVALCGAFAEFDEAPLANNCLKGVKWAPDGTCLLTASEDQMLRLFELPADDEPTEADAAAGTSPPSTELRSVVRAREGDSIYDYDWYPAMDSSQPLTCCFVSACRDHPVHLWDAYTGDLRASYTPYNHLDEVACAYSCAFDLGGGKIFCGFDRAVRIFDLSRPGRQCELRQTSATKKSRTGQRGIISCFAFAPDYSGLFAAGSYSGTTVRALLHQRHTHQVSHHHSGEVGGEGHRVHGSVAHCAHVAR